MASALLFLHLSHLHAETFRNFSRLQTQVFAIINTSYAKVVELLSATANLGFRTRDTVTSTDKSALTFDVRAQILDSGAASYCLW